MATLDKALAAVATHRLAGLWDPARAIGGPRFDALLLWGVPALALMFVNLWLSVAVSLPKAGTESAITTLVLLASVLTFAHLIAVAPRAYLNPDVFAAHKRRLIIVPILLIAALALSPTVFAIAAVVAGFWDVHHSAMQNFGLGRIYDGKYGNDPQQLRKTDLRLNWILYVGPLAAGPAFMVHLHYLDDLSMAGLAKLAQLPGLFEGHRTSISVAALTVWAAVIAHACIDYRKAMKAGYRLPIHKVLLIGTTGSVSLLAWGFSSPLVAFQAINIYHALQYFALVWLQEGKRMRAGTANSAPRTLLTFCAACALFGIGYLLARDADIKWLMAPFLACSLLHFWYDGFVWSVRKRQV